MFETNAVYIFIFHVPEFRYILSCSLVLYKLISRFANAVFVRGALQKCPALLSPSQLARVLGSTCIFCGTQLRTIAVTGHDPT